MADNILMTLGSERYLNRVNSQYILSSDVSQQYAGLLGAKITLTQEQAENLTDIAVTGYSSTTKLSAGTYQLVKFHSLLTITPARGIAVYWKAGEDPNEFIVTTDAPTGGTQFAGICINAVTAGYYGFILVAPGFGHAKGKASSLTNSGAVGQRLSVVAAAGTFDNPDNGAITDSTSGTATTNTFAAGVGVETLTIPITLANITGAGDVLTTLTPGYKFKILSFDAFVTTAVTTGSKAATLNLEIGTTNVTGGEIALTSANCTPLGAKVAGAAITAANTGTSSDTISIEAASVTAFAEGAIVVQIRIQNMDTADAVASIAAILNSRRLTPGVIAYEAPSAGALKKVYLADTVPLVGPNHF